MEKKPSNDQTLSDTNTQPQIGSLYNVKRGEDEYFPAELLEVRQNPLKCDCFEYFVHFVNTDKRLDEWVDVDRLDLANGPLPQNSGTEFEITNDLSERKLTRKQKRNNEIKNNVRSFKDNKEKKFSIIFQV